MLQFLVSVIVHAIRFAEQLAWVLGVLVILEWMLPRSGRPALLTMLRALVIWTLYLLIRAVLLASTDGLVASANGHALFWTLPPLAAAICAALISDCGYYWCHRAQHRWWWRWHSTHHAIRDLSAVNSYHHWLEELMRLPFIAIPMALLAPSGPREPIIGAMVLLQSYYLHAPTRLNFGRLRLLIADNRFHRIHHSLEPEHHDKNFAATFPLWDLLFGTLHLPKQDEWPDVGIPDRQEIKTVRGYLISGFYDGAVVEK